MSPGFKVAFRLALTCTVPEAPLARVPRFHHLKAPLVPLGAGTADRKVRPAGKVSVTTALFTGPPLKLL
jgi:hypothetical protein